MLCRQSIFKSSWHFSPDFLAQYKPHQAPELEALQPAPQSLHTYQPLASEPQLLVARPASLFSYENAQRMINIATIIFATIKIYERYQAIGITAQPNMNDYQWLASMKKMIASLCPDMLQTMGAYGFFLIDSTAIVFKALVYKAIAKLLLLCAHGDISDLIGSIAHGGVHTAKLLF